LGWPQGDKRSYMDRCRCIIGMSRAAVLEEKALALAQRTIELVKELLGQRLVSAAVFGSLAAGRFTEDRTSTSSSSSMGSPTNRWPSG
jgi:hypothetical protein